MYLCLLLLSLTGMIISVVGPAVLLGGLWYESATKRAYNSDAAELSVFLLVAMAAGLIMCWHAGGKVFIELVSAILT